MYLWVSLVVTSSTVFPSKTEKDFNDFVIVAWTIIRFCHGPSTGPVTYIHAPVWMIGNSFFDGFLHKQDIQHSRPLTLTNHTPSSPRQKHKRLWQQERWFRELLMFGAACDSYNEPQDGT